MKTNKAYECSCGGSVSGQYHVHRSPKYLLANKSDPTMTVTLRRLFVNQFKNRYNYISSLCSESIIKNNCFGYDSDKDGNPYSTVFSQRFSQKVIVPNVWKNDMYPIGNNRFKFNNTSEKIQGFMDWLKDMERSAIFQIVRQPGPLGTTPSLWANLYISTAYKKGIIWARQRMREDTDVLRSVEKTKADLELSNEAITTAFSQPTHADRVASVYTRTFTDLVGINAAMDAQISRILADGLVSGLSPYVIARNIADRISAIGIHRATLLARTEIIRAHHLASIQEYRNAGLVGVSILAEWSTAGDSRVCELCAALEGKVFTLDEIENKIPLHPQCRCAAIPVVVEAGKEAKAA